MSIAFTPSADRHFITALAHGTVTRADILWHLEEQWGRKWLAAPALVDARAMRVEFTGDDVRSIVRWLKHVDSPLGPMAVVVADEAAFGLMQMFQLLLEDVAVWRPFRVLADAEDWLRASGRTATATPALRYRDRRERARAMQTWARPGDAPLGVTNQEPEVLLMAVCPKCGSDRLKIIGQSNTKPPMMLHRCTACGHTVAGPLPDAPRAR